MGHNHKRTVVSRRILPCSRHNITLVPSRASVTSSILIEFIALGEDKGRLTADTPCGGDPLCDEALRALA
jgi:hypothetical protein